ncbi:hypothetical protein RE628_27410 [Paenibacillus sp. D2_2]|nr:hypothetical protein [Paenibacillus sp. D2_2]WMT40788.1 hypothetical protein RE628_27410 [Paenibacillus sp. D2_2]
MIAAHLTIGGETKVKAEVPVEVDRVHLKIKADITEYEMLYSLDGDSWVSLGMGEAYCLSPEGVTDGRNYALPGWLSDCMPLAEVKQVPFLPISIGLNIESIRHFLSGLQG